MVFPRVENFTIIPSAIQYLNIKFQFCLCNYLKITGNQRKYTNIHVWYRQ